MAATVSEVLEAEPRTGRGKGSARELRRSGRVPAIIYGDGGATRHLSLPARDLSLLLRQSPFALRVVFEGETLLTSPAEIQRHPVQRTIEHIDLRIVTDEEVTAMTQAAAAAAAVEQARLAAIEAAAADAAAVRAAAAAAAAAAASDKKSRK